MKNLFFIVAVLISIPIAANADTIVFMDGTKIDVPKAWEENGEIKCKMAGIVIGYPKTEVKQVIRQKQSAVPRKLRASEFAEVARTQPGSCYDLGKRYGYCTTLTLFGEVCERRDDILLPSRCQNRKDTDNGILEGIHLAFNTMDLPPISDTTFSFRSSSSCFDMGRRFGKCAALSMYGKPCEPADDVIMSLDCREQADTKSGINVGVRAAYKSLNFPVQ
jgi:hypothetical protein